MTSYQIMELLRAKHCDDVWVAECKNGPSQTGSHLRMDAWSMKKSWANPCVRAYEVKVSRSDFLGDEKWRGYLQYCNELVFCAPKGIIKDGELPAEIGLIECVGSRLVTRRKPVYREVDIPEELFRYILMCRARIGEEHSERDKASVWRGWLAQKEGDRKLGYNVSRAIRMRCEQMEREVSQAKEMVSRYDDVRRLMLELGIRETSGRWEVKRRVQELDSVIPEHFVKACKNLQQDLSNILFTCEKKVV